MNKYHSGKIYAIISDKLNKAYVGSTIHPLNERLKHHKYYHRHNIGGCTSKVVLDDNESYIKLLEEYPCTNNNELRLREGFHCQLYNTGHKVVNKRIEGRTPKQYYLQNIDKIKEKKRLYRIKNRDFINEVMYCDVCDCNYTRTNKSHHIKTQKHKKNMEKK